MCIEFSELVIKQLFVKVVVGLLSTPFFKFSSNYCVSFQEQLLKMVLTIATVLLGENCSRPSPPY